MTIFINPGSGPVADASEAQARSNLAIFIQEAGAPLGRIPLGEDQGDGRYRYVVSNGTQPVEVDMPGIPLEQVRWMNEDSGSIWDFPRLYVEGSSWIWKYALNAFSDEGSTDE